MRHPGWASGRPLPLLLICFLVAACGFHPMYGARADKPQVMAALNDVAIENIPDRHGQILRNDLIDRMYETGRPQAPKYHLTATIKGTEEGLGILENAVTTLTELTVTVTYTLTDQNGKEIVKGTAHSITSYNQIAEQYATLAAENDAYQRTLNEVANQIVNRLSLYFSEGALTTTPDANPAPPNSMPNPMTAPIIVPNPSPGIGVHPAP
jgi:LPS-assembly lipoprotein